MLTSRLSKNLILNATFTLVFIALSVSLVRAQTVVEQEQSYPTPQQGRRYYHGNMWGWGRNSEYGGMYNLNTVETIRGTVVSSNTFVPMNGMSQGIQLLVKTEDQTVPVHLGPLWYLDNQGFQINSGDKIEVKGSQINWAGNSIIMAAELRRGNQVLELRDNNGIPRWRGNQNWNRQRGWGSCCW